VRTQTLDDKERALQGLVQIQLRFPDVKTPLKLAPSQKVGAA
jgi:hypothetical protein